jgi:hypothetical protein
MRSRKKGGYVPYAHLLTEWEGHTHVCRGVPGGGYAGSISAALGVRWPVPYGLVIPHPVVVQTATALHCKKTTTCSSPRRHHHLTLTPS